MAGSTQTKTGEYLKHMARDGHYKQKLGEAALALTECYCKADSANRRRLGDELATNVHHILKVVYGWEAKSTQDASAQLREAFSNTTLPRGDSC